MTTRRVLALALLRSSLFSLGCGSFGCGGPASSHPSDPRHPSDKTPAVADSPPPFVERAAELGIRFEHRNGSTGAYHMAEISGSGVGLVDYDRDGDLDVYFVDSGSLPGGPASQRGGRLFRNQLESGTLRLVDVSDRSGDLGSGYGMGVAAGDYDGDGFVDLYLTALDHNQLLRNQGDGTFRDTTTEAGVGETRWSVPAAFFDADGDSDLDLYLGNYLDFQPERAPPCRDRTGAPDYCGPETFPPLPDRLFRNRGGGVFEDATAALGLDRAAAGPALGVVVADFDRNGASDLYVTNDGTPNHLWLNDGRGRFTESALLRGCALNALGQAEASMGIDAGDADGDLDLDLYLTHLVSETNTFYRNDGRGAFDDDTDAMQLSAPSRLHTGFGVAFIDYDQDGWLDLLVANGGVRKIEALAQAGDPFPFHERNLLLHNEGGQRYTDTSARAGAAFSLSEVSRGIAFGDLDNDGDEDAVISNNAGPARVLVNQRDGSSWLGVLLPRRAAAGGAPQTAHGAEAELHTTGRTLLRRVRVEGSYASANDPRLLFAVAAGTRTGRLVVRWPFGARETFAGLTAGRDHTVTEGEGIEGAGEEAPR